MRWRHPKSGPQSPKPFVVLPTLDRDPSTMSRNLSVRLFTKTWPRKNEEAATNTQRPQTATLDQPRVLDPQFMHQIDMSLIRHEFLAITNLCRIPPLAVRKDKKKKKKNENDEEKAAEINNNVNVSAKGLSNKHLPTPCTTCGRPDQPERFHSHPAAPQKSIKARVELKAVLPPPPTKSTVQKPMAIRYKSTLDRRLGQDDDNSKSSRCGRTTKVPLVLTCYICGRDFGTASLPLHEPKCLEKWERENEKLPPQHRKKAPSKPDEAVTKEECKKFAWKSSQAQLIPCKNCQRTFLPNRLEVHLRSCKETQNGQIKTNTLSSSSARNAKIHQPHGIPGLVQCAYCSKMFGSKSIKIHEPQCLKKQEKEKAQAVQDAQRLGSSTGIRKPPMFPCYLCGRLFSVNSIYIHEPQCLKKWRVENDKLPREKRRPVPPKQEIKFTPDGRLDFDATEDACWQSHLDQLVPCYQCKRTFNPDRVEVHERSCKGPTQQPQQS